MESTSPSIRRAFAALSTLALLALQAIAVPASAQEALVAPAPQAHPGPGSGIRVSAQVTEEQPGTVTVSLQLTGVRAAGGATLAYSLSGPGQILELDASPLAAGREAVRQVKVRLAPGEAHYLNVFTTQSGRGGVVSIALDSTPVRSKAATTRQPDHDAQGHPLTVLPGQLRN